jgi:hypothetical protein
MLDFTEVGLVSEGLLRDLTVTSHQQKVILRRMLYGCDATSTYDELAIG